MPGPYPEPDVQTLARAVDAYYNALLYDGMAPEHARVVEAQRQAAHQQLAQDEMQKALGGFRRL